MSRKNVKNEYWKDKRGNIYNKNIHNSNMLIREQVIT